jgi:hypothetical protein
VSELVVPADEISLSVADDVTSISASGEEVGLSSGNDLIPVSIEDPGASLDAESVIVIHEGEVPYTGRYTFTPSVETQTVPIGGKTASRDIIINPIPDNYGLITWNGAILTVS